MSESRDILREEFQDPEYRHAYAEDFLNTKIATQIRVLREQRGWTQADLAEKIGTKQAGVSRLENVNYSGWKIETLKRIARAFDVAFNAGFEAFGKLLDEAEEFGRQSLEKPSFEADPGFREGLAASKRKQVNIIRDAGASITGELQRKQNIHHAPATQIEIDFTIGKTISEMRVPGNLSLLGRFQPLKVHGATSSRWRSIATYKGAKLEWEKKAS
jgi:transcriptional regulator with XRE-family HTH domain